MSTPTRSEVLRIAIIVDGESCEELHQTEPADVVIGRASSSSLRGGPSLALETGVVAEGSAGERRTARVSMLIGLLMVVLAGGLFAHEVSRHVVTNAVVERPSSAALDGQDHNGDPTGTIALTVAFLGVVPLVGGATMLRGRRRRRGQQLTIYDGWARPKDYRKRAPVWLGVGVALIVFGGGLFAYEVRQREADAPITEATRGDMAAFKIAEAGGTGGFGFLVVLLGLVPAVVGAMGLQDAPVRPRKRKPKSGHAPREHKLFEWVEGEGRYYIDIPPETRGKIAFDNNRATVEQLRKRYGEGDRLRVELGPKTHGKLYIGQTKIIFRMAKPARQKVRPPFPVQHVDLLTHLRPSSLDAASLGAAAGVAVLLSVWFAYFSDRTQPPPPERFVREMGIPAEFYEPKRDEPEAPEEPDALEREDEERVQLRDEEEPEPELEKPDEVSAEAFDQVRNLAILRVLGTRGGPGEGTVLDVIQSTENDLDALFEEGMAVAEYHGGEIGQFVAGGDNIALTGTMASNAGLRTGDAPAVVHKIKKKEREVVATSSTGEVVGDIDTRSVAATIRRRMPGLEACYEKALRGNSSLGGKISYTITINTSGRVTEVEIEDDTVRDGSVRACTIGKIRSWRFLSEDAEESSEVSFSVAFAG